MVLDKLQVPGRPTILITVWQGPIALAVGAVGGGLDIFTLTYPFSSFSLSLEAARYRLKYCLKGPLNPKQQINQPTNRLLNQVTHRRAMYPLHTGGLFHCYMLDESICPFKGVGSILSVLSYV